MFRVNLIAALLMLSAAGAARAGDMTGESVVNCDMRKYSTRLALDPYQKRVWFVYLDQNGQPNMQLPLEIRVTEGQLVSLESGPCKGCFKFYFNLRKGNTHPHLLGVTSRPIGLDLKLDIYDMVIPQKPEQTWNKEPCYIKR